MSTSAFRVRPAVGSSPFVFTCEHASADLPDRYARLGLGDDHLADHIALDIGAAALAARLAAVFGAPLVESVWSRLLIDCNRDLGDHDLIVGETHGVVVPGNRAVDAAERAERIARYHAPYHDAVDKIGRASCRERV